MQIIPLGKYQKKEAEKIQKNIIIGKMVVKSNSELIAKEKNEKVALFLKIKNTRIKKDKNGKSIK